MTKKESPFYTTQLLWYQLNLTPRTSGTNTGSLDRATKPATVFEDEISILSGECDLNKKDSKRVL